MKLSILRALLGRAHGQRWTSDERSQRVRTYVFAAVPELGKRLGSVGFAGSVSGYEPWV
jgi:hypothetical protein